MAIQNTQKKLSAQDIGLIFVREYYTFLNKKPHRLYAFYSKDSLLVRGDEGTVDTTFQGQEAIRKKFEECQFEDCKVLITQVDSQSSADQGILIQVLGEMCNGNGPSKKFSQTFFLATQPTGYYVLNDIFRYLKDEIDVSYYIYGQEKAKAQEETIEIENVTTETIDPEEPDTIPLPSSVTQPEVQSKDAQSPPTPVVHIKKEVPVVKKPLKEESVKKEDSIKKEQVKKWADDVKAAQDVSPPKEPLSTEDMKKKKSDPKPKPEQKNSPPPQKQKPETVSQEQPVEQPSVVQKPATPKTWATLAAIAASPNSTTTSVPSTTTAEPVNTPHTELLKTEKTFVNGQQDKSVNPNQQQNKNQHHRKVEATQIFIKSVTETITEEQLMECFSQFGTVKSCNISRGKNCGFLEFASPESCQKALSQHKVQISKGLTVLAEERRYTTRYNNNNNNNNNNNQPRAPFEQRRSSNGRKQNFNQQKQGKGRGTVTVQK